MQARVKWVEGLTFIGESASGHQILMDGNSGDKAPSPMEMVLMAAGGCSADRCGLHSAKRSSRRDQLRSEADLQRREEAPRLFTHINLHFIVTGKALKDARGLPGGGPVGREILLGGADAGKSGEHHSLL